LRSIKKLLFTTAITAVIIFITLIHKNVSVVLWDYQQHLLLNLTSFS